MNNRNQKSRPSARNKRVKIIRNFNVNESGFVSATTTEYGPFWASVQPLTERLRTQYQSISVSATHSITIDGSINVLESDKIKFNDRIFDILTIKDPDENGRDKVIITNEIRPGQDDERG